MSEEVSSNLPEENIGERWERITINIKPHILTDIDKLVQKYPFRSRGEVIERALEPFLEAKLAELKSR